MCAAPNNSHLLARINYGENWTMNWMEGNTEGIIGKWDPKRHIPKASKPHIFSVFVQVTCSGRRLLVLLNYLPYFEAT